YPLALVAFAACTLAGCGGEAPVPTTPIAVVPTPAPTPAPVADPRAFGHICPLGAGNGPGLDCPHTQGTLSVQVNRAIDQALAEHPDLFDFSGDTPRVLDHARYTRIVVGNLNTMSGVCAIDDGEEIGVKNTNAYNEQWNIWFSRG